MNVTIRSIYNLPYFSILDKYFKSSLICNKGGFANNIFDLLCMTHNLPQIATVVTQYRGNNSSKLASYTTFIFAIKTKQNGNTTSNNKQPLSIQTYL